jgi:hypothetical protein
LKDKEIEESWNNFWKPILVKNDQLDIEQLKKELHDFRTLIHNTSEVYDHTTGGKISKVLTDPDKVIETIEDFYGTIFMKG